MVCQHTTPYKIMFDKICDKLDIPYHKKLGYSFFKRMWENLLFNYILSMFVYDGLPDNLPAREIEFKLMLLGKASLIVKNSKIYVAKGSFSGVTEYYDINPVCTWSLLDSTGVKRNYDFVRARNTKTEMSLAPLIEYYADLLTHAVLSMRASLINSRQQKLLIGSTQQQVDTLNFMYKSLYAGDLKAIIDTDSLSQLLVSGETGIKTYDLGAYSVGAVADYWQTIQNLLHNFFDMIGVRTHTDKKERLVTDEVISDAPMLQISIQDMLTCRHQMCEDVSAKWGDKFGRWSVKLNPEIYQTSGDAVYTDIDTGDKSIKEATTDV